MRNLLLILTLLFSTVFFSSTSFAGWTKVSEGSRGTYYVDFERIRKVDGYVYFWYMVDYLKPSPQGDCKLFRFKYLNDSYYTEPMGRGIPSTTSNKPDKEWIYPSPNSVGENILKLVCKTSKLKGL